MMNKPTLGFIGMGKVGQTLSQLWHQADYSIASIYNRSNRHLVDLGHVLNASIVSDPLAVVEQSDIVFLTVADDAIQAVAESLNKGQWQNKSVVHTSGATSLDHLSVLKELGARVGSLHPAFPFADVDTAKKHLKGATFAIEASDNFLQQQLVDLVLALDGQIINLPPNAKASYHAALSIASNYMVTLYAIAEKMLMDIGASKASTHNALNQLMGATMVNLQTQGIPHALTGPLSRADMHTLQAHLDALTEPNLHNAYRLLARLTFPMLQARGVDIEKIDTLLQQDEHHAANDS